MLFALIAGVAIVIAVGVWALRRAAHQAILQTNAAAYPAKFSEWMAWAPTALPGASVAQQRTAAHAAAIVAILGGATDDAVLGATTASQLAPAMADDIAGIGSGSDADAVVATKRLLAYGWQHPGVSSQQAELGSSEPLLSTSRALLHFYGLQTETRVPFGTDPRSHKVISRSAWNATESWHFDADVRTAGWHRVNQCSEGHAGRQSAQGGPDRGTSPENQEHRAVGRPFGHRSSFHLREDTLEIPGSLRRGLAGIPGQHVRRPTNVRSPQDIRSRPGPSCATPCRTRAAPVRIGATPGRIRAAPVRIGATPGRIRAAPIRIGTTSDRIRAAPIRIGTTSDRIRAAPIRIGTTSDRIRAAPIRIGTTSDRIRAAPIRIGTTSDRILTTPCSFSSAASSGRGFGDWRLSQRHNEIRCRPSGVCRPRPMVGWSRVARQDDSHSAVGGSIRRRVLLVGRCLLVRGRRIGSRSVSITSLASTDATCPLSRAAELHHKSSGMWCAPEARR